MVEKNHRPEVTRIIKKIRDGRKMEEGRKEPDSAPNVPTQDVAPARSEEAHLRRNFEDAVRHIPATGDLTDPPQV